MIHFSPSSFRHLLLLLSRKLFSLIFTCLALFHSFHLSSNITSLERLGALTYLKEYSFPFLVSLSYHPACLFHRLCCKPQTHFYLVVIFQLWPFSNKILTHIIKDLPQLSLKPEMVLDLLAGPQLYV